MSRRGIFPRPMGEVSRRLGGVIRQLQSRQRTALELAKQAQARGEVEFAASLRGKSHGYEEAVDLLHRLDAGDAIKRRNRFALTPASPESATAGDGGDGRG